MMGLRGGGLVKGGAHTPVPPPPPRLRPCIDCKDERTRSYKYTFSNCAHVISAGKYMYAKL